MKTIQYAVNMETGLVWSRFGSEIAFPVLAFNQMTPENNFTAPLILEKGDVFDMRGRVWEGLKWTKKIPKAIKNLHRQFWGMKPLV